MDFPLENPEDAYEEFCGIPLPDGYEFQFNFCEAEEVTPSTPPSIEYQRAWNIQRSRRIQDNSEEFSLYCHNFRGEYYTEARFDTLKKAEVHNDYKDNNIYIPGDDINDTQTENASVQVIFRNHAERLIAEINECDFVVGCVAWLTNYDILRALGKLQTVSILIQKEDFLRPDAEMPIEDVQKLRKNKDLINIKTQKEMLSCLYRRIPSSSPISTPFHDISQVNGQSDDYIEAIRCVGMCPKEKAYAMPRMHHKFLVFGKKIKKTKKLEIEELDFYIKWTKVWTGSYNCSYNAEQSFENAILISDKKVVDAYLKEWAGIYHLSEPLDWESRWVRPQYDVRT